MANPQRGEVALGSGVIRFNTEAIAKIEEATGKGYAEAFTAAPTSITTLRACLVAGYRKAEGGFSITTKEANALIDRHGVLACWQALQAAITLAMPDVFEEDAAGDDEDPPLDQNPGGSG